MWCHTRKHGRQRHLLQHMFKPNVSITDKVQTPSDARMDRTRSPSPQSRCV